MTARKDSGMGSPIAPFAKRLGLALATFWTVVFV